MAGYRQFHTKFWKDEYIIDLDPTEKLIYIYLFTNELSSISGIYKIPQRVIENETGFDRSAVTAALDKFQQDQKIMYADGVMWVVHMAGYHRNASPRTQAKVNSDIDAIPAGIVKNAYLYYAKTGIYSIDTVSIPNTEIKSLIEIERESRSKSDAAAVSLSDIPRIAQTVYNTLAGGYGLPADEQAAIIDAVNGLSLHYPTREKLEAYLRPFYDEFRRRYPHSIKAFWLTQWAVAGRVPDGKKGKTEPKYAEVF